MHLYQVVSKLRRGGKIYDEYNSKRNKDFNNLNLRKDLLNGRKTLSFIVLEF